MIEIFVSLSILVLLSVIIVSALANFRDTRELVEAEEKIISAFREARAKTIASENENQFGVHFSSSTVTVFVGPSYVAGDPQNITIDLSKRVEIFNANFAGQSTVFKYLTGEADPPGDVSVRLRKSPSETSTIYLNSPGLVYVE